MISYPCEPRLEDMLADPIVQAVMAADGVDPFALEVALRRAAALLGGRARPRNDGIDVGANMDLRAADRSSLR